MHMTTYLNGVTRLLTLTFATFLAISCGGGGGSVAGIDRGGIRTVAVGPVTGFGSIWLNGERYDVDNATISVDGQPALQSDISIGQVVILTGEIDDSTAARTADAVSYESNLEGPVAAVDLALGTLTVLGQTVFIDSRTVWGTGITPADLAGIKPGDLLEISGLVDNEQRLLATRVDLEDMLEGFTISGTVAGLQRDTLTFFIGGQRINYRDATLEGFPGGEPSNGDLVRVRTTPVVQATLRATSVAQRGTFVDVEEDDEGEIEGLITDFSGPTSFRVAGIPVRTDSNTRYSDGNAAALAPNVRIEAEGRFDARGTLLASEIKFRTEGDAEIEATVDTIQATENQLIVFGIAVEINSLTLLEDKSDQELRPFTIDDIQPGDFLKIDGYENTGAGATVIATKLERIDAEDQTRLRGIAQNIDQPLFELLGVPIFTDSQTDFSAEDVSISADAFFSSAADRTADAKGTPQGNTLAASEVELED